MFRYGEHASAPRHEAIKSVFVLHFRRPWRLTRKHPRNFAIKCTLSNSLFIVWNNRNLNKIDVWTRRRSRCRIHSMPPIWYLQSNPVGWLILSWAKIVCLNSQLYERLQRLWRIGWLGEKVGWQSLVSYKLLMLAKSTLKLVPTGTSCSAPPQRIGQSCEFVVRKESRQSHAVHAIFDGADYLRANSQCLRRRVCILIKHYYSFGPLSRFDVLFFH